MAGNDNGNGTQLIVDRQNPQVLHTATLASAACVSSTTAPNTTGGQQQRAVASSTAAAPRTGDNARSRAPGAGGPGGDDDDDPDKDFSWYEAYFQERDKQEKKEKKEKKRKKQEGKLLQPRSPEEVRREKIIEASRKATARFGAKHSDGMSATSRGRSATDSKKGRKASVSPEGPEYIASTRPSGTSGGGW